MRAPAKTQAFPKLIGHITELIVCSLLYQQQLLQKATLLRTKLRLSETSHRPAPSKPHKDLSITPLIVRQTYQAIPE